MKSQFSISPETIGKALAEDETGELMGGVLASILANFWDDEQAFSDWIRSAAMNAAALDLGDEWSKNYLVELARAAPETVNN